MNIGMCIKEYRQMVAMTQKELAEHLGKDERTIRRYETNTVDPSIKTLDKIASVLGVDICNLIQGE